MLMVSISFILCVCIETNIFCCSFSHVQLFATPWTVTHKDPVFVEFSRQEYWSRLPCRPPGDLPDPGIEPMPPASPALADEYC